MKYDADDSPVFVASCTSQYVPYRYSLISAASTYSSSVWSDAASQSSDDTSISANTSDSDSCDSCCTSKWAAVTTEPAVNHHRSLQRDAETVPAELRQNPRRTAPGTRAGRGCPPALVRQSDRKITFVDSLVDSSTSIVEAIWPLSSAVCRSELGSKSVLPLRTFIQETLRRSRTSYSTLQVALYYLILVKPHVPKHNFTTEQPNDRHADRALQCGRRMFLAALILASKYLQDRNYSARAWSKISGLNTQEINQNEIAFLLAVNWKLHITDHVFQRWIEIVLTYTPPSPGPISQTYAQQSSEWKQLILKLEPELTNIQGLLAATTSTSTSTSTTLSDLSVLSPRSILNVASEGRPSVIVDTTLAVPTSKVYNAPVAREPIPNPRYTSGRPAPALGLLPTPRLTPQTSGFCTPAVSAASQILGKCSAMGFALAQASSFDTAQTKLDRFPCPVETSPNGYYPARRSSLANSVSTASSPESMVSDSSRSSRSSSISSASSLASAILYNSRCSVPSRSRAAKIWNDRVSLKPSVPSVPEDFDEQCMMTATPELYSVVSGIKAGAVSLKTPFARRETRLEDMTGDAASNAARVLQDLHNHDVSNSATPTACSDRKRGRASSIDNSLHENVRRMLVRQYGTSEQTLSDNTLLRSRGLTSAPHLQGPTNAALGRNAKRVCCSTEAVKGYQTADGHPVMSLVGGRYGLGYGVDNSGDW